MSFPKYAKKFCGGAHALGHSLPPIFEAPLPRLKEFFVKKYNKCGLLTTTDIPVITGYVAYKPHTFSWLLWFINHNSHVKRRSHLGTFCLVLARSSRELNISRRPHLFLPKSDVRRVVLQQLWKVGQILWFINHNLWSVLRKFRTLRRSRTRDPIKFFTYLGSVHGALSPCISHFSPALVL